MDAARVTIDLSHEQMDRLWEEAIPYMESSQGDAVEAALSGDDPMAARAYIRWLRRTLAQKQPLPEDVRTFAVRALDRFFSAHRLSMGQAFGIERTARGAPPKRQGVVRAINGLISFLNVQKKYGLAESSKGPSAFDVASALLKYHWDFDPSPYTLRDEYWSKRKEKKGKISK